MQRTRFRHQLIAVCVLSCAVSWGGSVNAVDEIQRASIRVCEQPGIQKTSKPTNQQPAIARVSSISSVDAKGAVSAAATDDGQNRGEESVGQSKHGPTFEAIAAPEAADTSPALMPAGSPLDSPTHFDASDGLNVNELVSIALANHPTLRQADAAVEKADGLQFQSGRKYNPTIGYVANEIGNDGFGGQHGAYIGQTFLRKEKRQLNQQVYSAEVDRLQYVAAVQRLRVTTAVRQAYFDLVYLRRRVAVLDRLLKLATKNVELTRGRFEADEVSKTDLLRSQLETQQLALTSRHAQTRIDSAQRKVAAAIGMPQYDLSGKVVPPASPPTDLEFDSLWQRLASESPELAVAAQAIRKARLEIQRAEVQPLGNVNTQLSIQYDTSTDSVLTGVQVGVPIAVHDKNVGNIRAATAGYKRASDEYHRLQLQLRSKLADAFAEYQSESQTRIAMNEKMLPLAKESLELTTELYNAGEVSFIELVTAQRSYLRLNLQMNETEQRLWRSVIAFDQFLIPGSDTAPSDVLVSPYTTR